MDLQKIKMLRAKYKSIPDSPKVKESYFATCERDDEGHCLPSGQSGKESEKEKDVKTTSGNYIPNVVYRGGTNQEESGSGIVGGVFITTDEETAKNYGPVSKHVLSKQPKVIDLGNWNSPAAKAFVAAVMGIKPSSMSKFDFEEYANEILIGGQGAEIIKTKFRDFSGYRIATDVFLVGKLGQYKG